MKYNLKFLPPDTDLETKAVLKKLPAAHRRLAELKGISSTDAYTPPIRTMNTENL